MSWLSEAPTGASPFERVLGLAPALLDHYRAFYGQLWDDNLVSGRLLELCRLRIAGLHDCTAERVIRHAGAGVSDADVAALDTWPTSERFSELERAALALADKMPGRQHDVTDADVAALRVHLSEPEVVALVLAAGMFDAQCRLRLVLDIAAQAGTVDAPARGDGVVY